MADIPDELLRHSGMLWVTAIVEDARGKTQTHSRCVCTECAVRPDDYSAGGGSGGGSAGGLPEFVINLTYPENPDDTSYIVDKTFDEVSEVMREWPPTFSNLVLLAGGAGGVRYEFVGAVLDDDASNAAGMDIYTHFVFADAPKFQPGGPTMNYIGCNVIEWDGAGNAFKEYGVQAQTGGKPDNPPTTPIIVRR